MQEIVERTEKLLTGVGLLMEGVGVSTKRELQFFPLAIRKVMRSFNMLSQLVVFSAAAALALHINIKAQSPPNSPGSPAIVGSFLHGKYSNEILGIALELPPSWQTDGLAESEAFSRSLPRRMHLWFRSDDDGLLLAAYPVDPDEKLDQVYKVSLLAVQDGGRFRAIGKQIKTNIDGCEVLSQKLHRRSEQGDQIGEYRAFFSRGYYVSILHSGPKRTEETREAILQGMQIQKARQDLPKPSGMAGSN